MSHIRVKKTQIVKARPSDPGISWAGSFICSGANFFVGTCVSPANENTLAWGFVLGERPHYTEIGSRLHPVSSRTRQCD